MKHLASISWKFLVFDDDVPNAMVLPDGGDAATSTYPKVRPLV